MNVYGLLIKILANIRKAFKMMINSRKHSILKSWLCQVRLSGKWEILYYVRDPGTEIFSTRKSFSKQIVNGNWNFYLEVLLIKDYIPANISVLYWDESYTMKHKSSILHVQIDISKSRLSYLFLIPFKSVKMTLTRPKMTWSQELWQVWHFKHDSISQSTNDRSMNQWCWSKLNLSLQGWGHRFYILYTIILYDSNLTNNL